MALGQVRRLGRPVVHLGVDVDGVVAAPRRTQVRIPDALQVGRRPSGAGRADEQVSAVLVVERLEPGIDRAGGVLAQPPIGRERVLRPAAEIQRDAAEQRSIVGDVRAAQAFERAPRKAVETRGRRPDRIGPEARLRVERRETGFDRNSQQRLPRAAHRNRRRTSLDAAIGLQDADAGSEPRPLAVRGVVIDHGILDVAPVVRLRVLGGASRRGRGRRRRQRRRCGGVGCRPGR